MNCYLCKMDAVAMQSEAVTHPKPCETNLDVYVYIPVCEEHKSDSTLDEMVIPLPSLGKDCSDSAYENCASKLDALKRLKATRESLEASEQRRIELDREIATVRGENKRLGDQLELSNRTIDSYKETCKTWEEHVDELDKELDSLKISHSTQLGRVLKFIREYFSTSRFPGFEHNAAFDMTTISDEQLLELIQLGRTAYHSKQALSNFVDSLG